MGNETHSFSFDITCNDTLQTIKFCARVVGASDEAYEDIADRAYEAASVRGEREFGHSDFELVEIN